MPQVWFSCRTVQSTCSINKLYGGVKQKYSGCENKEMTLRALWESIQVNVFFFLLCVFFFHHLANACSDATLIPSLCTVMNTIKTILLLSHNTNISFTEVLKVQDASSEVRASGPTATKYSSLAQL